LLNKIGLLVKKSTDSWYPRNKVIFPGDPEEYTCQDYQYNKFVPLRSSPGASIRSGDYVVVERTEFVENVPLDPELEEILEEEYGEGRVPGYIRARHGQVQVSGRFDLKVKDRVLVLGAEKKSLFVKGDKTINQVPYTGVTKVVYEDGLTPEEYRSVVRKRVIDFYNEKNIIRNIGNIRRMMVQAAREGKTLRGKSNIQEKVAYLFDQYNEVMRRVARPS
jgi:hypothetical protein